MITVFDTGIQQQQQQQKNKIIENYTRFTFFLEKKCVRMFVECRDKVNIVQ